MREILATEMLEALGVETSKTFSLIETGEALERNDEPSPTRSAVLVRLQHSHIRIGTFQRLATLGETDNIRKLDRLLPASLLWRRTAATTPGRGCSTMSPARTARLAASYIAAGFVHGVLNSDNIAITAESFDYGPWRWTPYWDGHFTAAYFDHAGLYSFGRQPEAIHWDLVQLARSLTLDRRGRGADAGARDASPTASRRRCATPSSPGSASSRGELAEDMKLVAAIEEALAQQTVTIDRFFFDWRGGARGPRRPTTAYATSVRDADPSASRIGRAGALDHPYWSDPEPCSMHIEEVEAIWSAIDEADDWAPLHAKIAAVRRMGEALDANA